MTRRPFAVHDGGGASDVDERHEEHHGQLRFAQRFLDEHAGRFLHVHGLGWHEYDDTRWAECLDGGEMRAVKATVHRALGEVSTVAKDERKTLLRDIGRVESYSGMQGVLGIAGAEHPCTAHATAMDADPHLLNTASGTIDLRTSRVRTPSPADRLTKVTAATFDPDAHYSVFDQFLETVQPDPETRAFLARCLGSALLGLVREQHLLIWFGTGANGKGTLRDAVAHALGEYAVEVPADILLASKYGASHLAPERMRLRGARVAFCSEIAENARMDEAVMKKLTGGDPVTGKLLYRNPVEFQPSHTLFMLTNHLPVVRGDDPAVWRRILAVPFDVVVPASERDPELPEKLKTRPDAVLAWLWRGWLDYSEQGLNPPLAVRAATEKYMLDSDLVARFLADESVVVVGHGATPSAQLYRAFLDWARTEGEAVQMSNKAFTQALEKRGFSRGPRTSAGVQWSGISIVSDEAGR